LDINPLNPAQAGRPNRGAMHKAHAKSESRSGSESPIL